jgi:thiamine pyrophosphokinase
MKRAVIFINGNLSDQSQEKKIIKKTDFLIAADGGANLIEKLKLTPNIIIGDMDSIKPELLKKYKSINYPRKKDKADFELAVDYCLKNKFQEIIIFGFLGDRIDHMMANIFLLAKTLSENNSIKMKIIEGQKEIFILNKEIVINGKIGDEISIVPVSEKLEGVITDGLEYKLNNEVLLSGSTRGISNVMTKASVKISAINGTALIIHLRK